MKIKLHCAYLFGDGHAVLVYEKQDRQAGEIRWAEVIERFGPDCNFAGRIVVHSAGLLYLCRHAKVLRAKAPSLEAGSLRTRELGIPVGTLEVGLTTGRDHSVYFHDFEGVLSAPYSYEPERDEKFDAQIAQWGNYRVAKVHRQAVNPQPAHAEAGDKSVAA